MLFVLVLVLITLGSFFVYGFRELPLPSPQSIPEKLSIGNRIYLLETDIWRDFQPSTDPLEGIIVFITVIANNSQKLPPSIKLNYLWIINNEETWPTRFSEQKCLVEEENTLAKIARNGPFWTPGSLVDVIVQLMVNYHETYLLKALNQTIGVTF